MLGSRTPLAVFDDEDEWHGNGGKPSNLFYCDIIQQKFQECNLTGLLASLELLIRNYWCN